MLISHLILALAAVAMLALRPRSSAAAVGVVLVATLDLALGAPALPALETVAPLLAFLSAALTLSRSSSVPASPSGPRTLSPLPRADARSSSTGSCARSARS